MFQNLPLSGGFFRRGKGGQASLTFYQSTYKIIELIPDFMSYMKMSRLIKTEVIRISTDSNWKRYGYRSEKELVVIELINSWCCFLQVGNTGNILLSYHDNGCSTNKEAGLISHYNQYRSYVRRPVCLISTCKELPRKDTFCVWIV